MQHEIATYEQARSLISEIATTTSFFDIKQISDKALAMQHYARMAEDTELEAWVAEVRLRAFRRLGELSAALPKATGSNLPNVTPSGHPGKRAELKAAGISKDTAHKCEKLARISEAKVESFIADKRGAGKAFTVDEVISVLGKQQRKDDVTLRAAEGDSLTVSDLCDLKARGMRFGTIYADPPWLYENQASRAATGNHYVGMTTAQIAALPVAELAEVNAHLHLWTTNAFLFQAREVMEAWGFDYRSCYVWTKPQLGLGNYWRVSHEFLLLGVRGSRPFADQSLRSWGQFDRGPRHSAKPEEVRALIERASPTSRLELFGREAAKGWTVWGNEAPRGAFEESL